MSAPDRAEPGDPAPSSVAAPNRKLSRNAHDGLATPTAPGAFNAGSQGTMIFPLRSLLADVLPSRTPLPSSPPLHSPSALDPFALRGLGANTGNTNTSNPTGPVPVSVSREFDNAISNTPIPPPLNRAVTSSHQNRRTAQWQANVSSARRGNLAKVPGAASTSAPSSPLTGTIPLASPAILGMCLVPLLFGCCMRPTTRD